MAALAFLLLLGAGAVLFMGRKYPGLRVAFLENNFSDFYQHISNFSISLFICSMIGFILLMLDVPSRYIAAMCIAIIFFNAIYELFIPMLNTRDIIDAYYGIAGTVVGFVFVTLLKQFGLKEFSPQRR